MLYRLNAVLIHRGPSAYSGHYIAHVRHARTGQWLRLNDEETSVLKDKRSLGTEVRVRVCVCVCVCVFSRMVL